MCKRFGVELTTRDILDIMHELEEMHKSKKIVKNDNRNDPTYRKTLLCQNHNSSGGLSNKFVQNMSVEQTCEILNDPLIKKFMETHNYI